MQMDSIPVLAIWMIGIVGAAYIVLVIWLCWPQEAINGDREEMSRKEKFLKIIMREAEAMIDEVAGAKRGLRPHLLTDEGRTIDR